MRLRKADREARSSDRHNNIPSWISEVKGISNVTVKKKRGRRAPPPAKRLCGKQVDKVVDSDDAVDNDIDDTEEGQVDKGKSIGHIAERTDGRTGDQDLPKTDQSGNSSDVQSSASEEHDYSTNSKAMSRKASTRTTRKVSEVSTRSKQDAHHFKQVVVDSEPTDQNPLANEDGSCMQAAVGNKVVGDKNSQEIKVDQASDAQVNTSSSDDKSSEEVEDVKVCDICGDVGEEEKLAVCSKCNDGAEHIYCMRVMMEEVPDSQWLCEDCQTELEFEKEKKLEKCQVMAGASKGQPFEGKVNKPAIAAKCRNSSDSELDTENVCSNEPDIANEAIASSDRETIPEPGVSYMGAGSRKKLPLSRESACGSDEDKGKQPSHQVATSLASNVPKSLAPQPRGQLSKSTSFNNSKVPKVKQLVNDVPQKPKSLKESWSSILKKEGPISMTTKSATFKKPKPPESKSSILPPAEEPRVVNPMSGQNVTDDKFSSILGTPSATTPVIAPVLSKADTTTEPLATGNNYNGSGVQRKVIQNSDPSHRDNKIKDPAGFRPGASSSNRSIRCQRCNEAGHSTQFCAVDKLRLSAIKPLSERNMKDTSAKRNKTSEVSTLVVSGKAASKSVDHSEQILRCGTYQNSICGPKDVLLASCSHLKKPSPLFPRANVHDTRSSMSTLGNAASVFCSKLKFKDDHPSESAVTGIPADIGPTIPSDCRDESNQGFSAVDGPTASTVPELDYIWQGGFELWRTGRSPELCDGFQAHLSCSASQLVLDVAKKFPSKVQLEEVPRQASWPIQFQESCPTYENVGLFFFARDLQSYENHYSKLVENMLNNDLVLRGSIDTVELLIFPSNILSNFQRWNMFYFLWGVFRVSRKDCSNLPPDLPTSKCESILNGDPRAMDPRTSVLSSSYSFSKTTNNLAEHGLKSTSCADHDCLPSLEASHRDCLNGENSLNQPVSGRPDDRHDSAAARCSTNNNGAINHSASATETKHQKPDYLEYQDKMRDTCDGNVSERDIDVNTVPVACPASNLGEEPGKESTTIDLNDAEDLMDIDHVNTTKVNASTLDPLSHASGGSRKRYFETDNGANEVDGAPERNKKVKLDNVMLPNIGSSQSINDGKLSSKVHPLVGSRVDGGTDNKAIAGSSNSDGKCVFPLDLNAVDDAVSENIVIIPSSDDEELPEPVQLKVGEKQNKEDSLPTDITSSLSLSLAFPSRKEHASKLQSGPQRQLPERNSKINSSPIWGQK